MKKYFEPLINILDFNCNARDVIMASGDAPSSSIVGDDNYMDDQLTRDDI